MAEIDEKFLERHGITATAAEAEDFRMWIVNDLWDKYSKDKMDRQVRVREQINALPIVVANATQGKEYRSQPIKLPLDIAFDYRFEGIEDLGLVIEPVAEENAVEKTQETPEGELPQRTISEAIIEEPKCVQYVIKGTPNKAGDFTILLKYKRTGWIEGEAELERKIPFAVNPDPRTLWKNLPVPEGIPFPKPDTAKEYVKVEAGEDGQPKKDIVAASRRGRSHAQEGKPRDDHFKLFHCPDSDWYIMAVADGAGSAKYSRRGSEIACNTVMEYCKGKLLNCAEFEEKIRAYKGAEDEQAKQVTGKAVGDGLYGIVGNAAFMAHKAINEAAKINGDVPKDYATTLLLAICKKFDFGWFVGSFWVGDGAMCLYEEGKSARLLGIPDEGEYSGQTRFLTMPEIFADSAAIFQRLRLCIVEDFTALLLMTDGVSDPMFGTDANLNSVEKWNELWETLKNGFPEDQIKGVELTDDNEDAQNELLAWLDFWKPGEHDDRTIAILY